MYILSRDDEAVGTPVDWEVPDTVRALGKAPDIELLEAGDCVLFEALGDEKAAGLIKAAQRKTFAENHARWTHVAIIFNKERWVEAVRRGVSVGSVFDACTTHNLRFRRAVNVPIELRTLVAMEAMTSIGAPYTLGQSVYLGVKAVAPWLLGRSFRPHEEARICSQLFSDAFRKTTDLPPIRGVLSDVMPAHLSMSTTLTDIYVPWRPLAG